MPTVTGRRRRLAVPEHRHEAGAGLRGAGRARAAQQEGRRRRPTRPDSGLYTDVADVDGDGDLDLIVGGYSHWKPVPPVLADEQKELAQRLQTELRAVDDEMQKLGQAIHRGDQGPRGRSREQEGPRGRQVAGHGAGRGSASRGPRSTRSSTRSCRDRSAWRSSGSREPVRQARGRRRASSRAHRLEGAQSLRFVGTISDRRRSRARPRAPPERARARSAPCTRRAAALPCGAARRARAPCLRPSSRAVQSRVVDLGAVEAPDPVVWPSGPERGVASQLLDHHELRRARAAERGGSPPASTDRTAWQLDAGRRARTPPGSAARRPPFVARRNEAVVLAGPVLSPSRGF
jgi:hypothetical protein